MICSMEDSEGSEVVLIWEYIKVLSCRYLKQCFPGRSNSNLKKTKKTQWQKGKHNRRSGNTTANQNTQQQIRKHNRKKENTTTLTELEKVNALG